MEGGTGKNAILSTTMEISGASDHDLFLSLGHLEPTSFFPKIENNRDIGKIIIRCS